MKVKKEESNVEPIKKVEKEVCPNCDNSGKACVMCHAGDKVE